MATFNASDEDGTAVQMLQMFRWSDSPIGEIDINLAGSEALVADAFDNDITVIFGGGTGLAADGTNPTGGTYTSMTWTNLDGATMGTLSGFAPANFSQIDTPDAFRVLDGNDTIIGSFLFDTLFAGYGGNDYLFGNGGGDSFFIATANGAPTHQVLGDTGFVDEIIVVPNRLTDDTLLDLRSATLYSIERLLLTDGIAVTLNSSQFGASGLSEIGMFSSGSGTFRVVMDAAGTLNLSGAVLYPDYPSLAISVIVEGTSGADTIFGTGAKDTFRAGAGVDKVNGNGGNDIFEVGGEDSQFDAFNGGSGSDKIKVFGATAVTLNGFNAAAQAIEVWEGNGQSLLGDGNANTFNLAGLTGMTGLPFVEGLGGNDTMTGSKFVDHLLGGDGDDTISAGVGADELEGGLGVDTLSGGADGDRFDFDAVAEIGKKKGLLDLITDWGEGDTIDLSSIDANGAKTGDKAWKFLKKEGADFTKAGQLGFDQKKSVTYVQGDTNGDGKADFKLQVAGKIDFEKADFIL